MLFLWAAIDYNEFMDSIIFIIDGGIGKNIASTAVTRNIKAKCAAFEKKAVVVNAEFTAALGMPVQRAL